MIETFTALAEPNRLRIVDLLKDGPRSVNEIGARLKLAQPQVSKHLRVLKTARLVDVEPRAQQRLYGLRGDRLRDLSRWLDNYRALWAERMDQLDDLVQELGEADRKKEERNARRRKKK